MENFSKVNGSNDPTETIEVSIKINTENEISVEVINNFSDEEEYDFSCMDYKEAMAHLMEISEEMRSTNEILYSKSYLVSLFETLIELFICCSINA